MKTIGESAFESCSLTSVTIPDSVKTIGDSAFSSCDLTSVTIPDFVTEIGCAAFSGCSSTTVSDNNPNYTSVDGVLFNKSKTELIQYPIGNSQTVYEIPNSVIEIAVGAFLRCESLTSLNIPDSVKTIGTEVFKDCDSLTSVTVTAGSYGETFMKENYKSKSLNYT